MYNELSQVNVSNQKVESISIQRTNSVVHMYEGCSESSRKVLLNRIAFVDCYENS